MKFGSIIKEKFLVTCIRFLERELLKAPTETLSQEQTDGLLATLWDNAAFRNFLKERNAKLVYNIAGIAGSEVEPRDKTRLMLGQRVENLVLAAKTKHAALRRDKAFALKIEPKKN